MTETFRSAEPNGTWILRFEDGWAGDAGEVTCAELIIEATGRDRQVTTLDDSGSGSLREALTLAQPGDAVRIRAASEPGATEFINLQSALPQLPDGVGIFGPRDSTMIVQGNRSFRAFEIVDGHQATLANLWMNNFEAEVWGGAIHNLTGILTVTDCRVTESFRLEGGGSTSFEMHNSTITDLGGPEQLSLGIVSQGPGSSVHLSLGGNLLASATSIATGVFNGGLPPVIVSRGFNLATDNVDGRLTAESDLLNTDPVLQPVQLSNGKVFHPLGFSSPAIDRGRSFGPGSTDQRGEGFSRIIDLDDSGYPNGPGSDGSDIGAIELQSGPADRLFSDAFEGS